MKTLHLNGGGIAVLLSLLIAAGGLPACDRANHEAEEQHEEHAGEDEHNESETGAIHIEPDVQQRFGIATVPATANTVEVTLDLPGEIVHEVDRIVHVHPRFAGVIRSHRKHIGDWVDAGEVLVTIENNESLAPYDVKAPISGVLVDGHAHPGEAVGVDQELYTISDTRKVWVELQVFPSDVERVREGQQVDVRLPNSDRSFFGAITFVKQPLNHQTRTATARVVMDNPTGALRPGLFVTGRVAIATTHAQLTVPTSALVREGKIWIVFVREGEDRFVEHPVQIGHRGLEFSEVIVGLDPGALVVSDGAFIVKSVAARDTIGGDDDH